MYIIQNFKIKIMIKSLKTISLIFFILLATTNASSQTDSKEVSITSSGSGKTQEDAKQAALRSATEQAFGAFISSKTEMFNDQVVADQMASVSSGNIKSFSILNESQLPDGSWGVTLKALVSVDKLTSFVEAKGIAIEIKGGMFALNIKQQLLNEQGEIKAVDAMFGILHETMQSSFDYNITSGEPISKDAESKNWEIPLTIKAICNKNMDFCANYLIKTLRALSLSTTEVEKYKSLNKEVFPIQVQYKAKTEVFNLRKLWSAATINSLASNWEFYTRLFTIQSGKYQISGLDKVFLKPENVQEFYQPENLQESESSSGVISFLSTGQHAGTHTYNDSRTLEEIEQMTGYSIKPSGLVSYYKHGGYVIQQEGQYKIGLGVDKTTNLVNVLTEGMPASMVGIQKGDSVISINDIAYKNIEQITDGVKRGNSIILKVARDGQALSFVISPKFLEQQKGLVVAPFDIGKFNWADAKTACEDLIMNGYSDWYLPSKEELNIFYGKLFRADIGCFKSFQYWSMEGEDGYAWYFNFGSGNANQHWTQNSEADALYVRPVRSF
jgi:hypothetical protein